MCEIKIKLKDGFPAYSKELPTKELRRKYKLNDGSEFWSHGGVALMGETQARQHIGYAGTPKYIKQELPKRFKKLLRIAKRTKVKIISVKSIFDNNGNWIRCFELAEGRE